MSQEESLRKMRESLDAMTGSLAEMWGSLPESHTATRAMLERTIPAWESVVADDLLQASRQWTVLIMLSDGLKDAIFDMDTRLSALEDR